jgi:hypothetical protein
MLVLYKRPLIAVIYIKLQWNRYAVRCIMLCSEIRFISILEHVVFLIQTDIHNQIPNSGQKYEKFIVQKPNIKFTNSYKYILLNLHYI